MSHMEYCQHVRDDATISVWSTGQREIIIHCTCMLQKILLDTLRGKREDRVLYFQQSYNLVLCNQRYGESKIS